MITMIKIMITMIKITIVIRVHRKDPRLCNDTRVYNK